MRDLGIGICIIGSILAILFVPCKIVGIGTGWHFILGNAGMGMKNYQIIDSALLLIELLLINGIGIGCYLLAHKIQLSKEECAEEFKIEDIKSDYCDIVVEGCLYYDKNGMKLLQENCGLSKEDANTFLKSLPSSLMTNITKQKAIEVVEKLKDGFIIKVVPSNG